MARTKKFYAVAKGRKPGIYTDWFGPKGAEAQIRGVNGARYKGFATLSEAQQWLEDPGTTRSAPRRQAPDAPGDAAEVSPGTIIIYTDGGCRGNPGPGGYGVVILDDTGRVELSGGFRLTTNNRMELLAGIVALEALPRPSIVLLHSDSRYVVNGISKGWAKKWRANNWLRTRSEPAENADLWARLLESCERHQVKFIWVPGHAGHDENERCDLLATRAADGTDLAEDSAYEQGRTTVLGRLFGKVE